MTASNVRHFASVSNIEDYRALSQDPATTFVWYYSPTSGIRQPPVGHSIPPCQARLRAAHRPCQSGIRRISGTDRGPTDKRSPVHHRQPQTPQVADVR